MTYTIQFSPEALEHLAGLTANQRSTVRSAIEKNLKHEPSKQTRNRKLLRRNELAAWELRVGDLRVLYDVDEPTHVVDIRAVGVKDGNRLLIGGEEVDL
jgi:mRNA-degrading endonuclease RelE of RelBE toxin-antitoxin system